MQPVPRAGKHTTGANGGKTCNQCQGRKNMHLAPRAKKHASGGPRDELSAGKHEPGAKGGGGGGRTCNRCPIRKINQKPKQVTRSIRFR